MDLKKVPAVNSIFDFLENHIDIESRKKDFGSFVANEA